MDSIEKNYSDLYPAYLKLGKNLKESIKIMLENGNIEFHDVRYRIKELDSFKGKIQRKGYSNPFEEIEDFCGLRIICYYQSDIDRIADLINATFDVKESEDKSSKQEPNKFGYRSMHFIIRLKKEWTLIPNFQGLAHIKAEIQVRTILMHAWADVEHKLSYKKTDHVPPEFSRSFSQLSALFEMADEKFDSLKKAKENLKNESKKKMDSLGKFDTNQHMNADTLQAFLDYHFPDRKKIEVNTLLDEILNNDINFEDLLKGYEKVKEYLPELERRRDSKWAQVGVIRVILDLTNDKYWNNRKVPDYIYEQIIEFRDRIYGDAS